MMIDRLNITIGNAREWVHALRSGEYRQAHGRLRDEDRFCCLGVYCDLMQKRGEGSWNEYGEFEYQGMTAVNQIEFVYDGQPLGESDDDTYDETNDFARRLADLNDYGATLAELKTMDEEEAEKVNAYTFAQIADEIEKRFAL